MNSLINFSHTISDELAAAIMDMKTNSEIPKTFWNDGEISDKIGYVVTDSKVVMRHTRLRTWLLSNGHPCFDTELRALCLWHKVKNDKIKIPVLGFKYLLLKEAEKVKEQWSLMIDSAAEKLAWQIVRENKEKARD